jgi:hypothetical protein
MRKMVLVSIATVFIAALLAGCTGGGGGSLFTKDCGNVTGNIAGDAAYKCFNDSAAKCAPAKLKVDTRYMLATGYSTNVVGYLMYMEIKGGTQQACKFYSRYDDLFMPTGLTPEQQQNLTATASLLKGKDMTCTMTTAEITTGEMGLEDTCSKCTGTVIDLLKTMGACPGGNVSNNTPDNTTGNVSANVTREVGSDVSISLDKSQYFIGEPVGITATPGNFSFYYTSTSIEPWIIYRNESGQWKAISTGIVAPSCDACTNSTVHAQSCPGSVTATCKKLSAAYNDSWNNSYWSGQNMSCGNKTYLKYALTGVGVGKFKVAFRYAPEANESGGKYTCGTMKTAEAEFEIITPEGTPCGGTTGKTCYTGYVCVPNVDAVEAEGKCHLNVNSSVAITVRSQHGTQPAQMGATVKIYTYDALLTTDNTDSHGVASFSLAPGWYSVYAVKTKCKANTMPMSIPANTSFTILLNCQAQGA